MLLTTLVACLIAGCASQPGGRSTTERAARSERSPDQSSSAAAAETTAALVEVETDVGFTVTEVVEISSKVRAMHTEALALIAGEDYAGGIALLKEVVAAAPGATGPLVDLGIAYSRAGSLDEARAQLEAALALTPDHPVAHNELGMVMRRLGEFQAARQSYQRALEIYPGFHYARRNLAVLCDLYLADLDCALQHYGLYRAAVPDDHEVEIWIGDLELRMAASGGPTEASQ